MEHLDAGGLTEIDVAEDDIVVSLDGRSVQVDLGDKAMRRLLESAGILADADAGHEMLNR